MQHPQTLVVLLLASCGALAVAFWLGSLWAGLAALVTLVVLAFVVVLAWTWSPRSGIGRGRRPSQDAASKLP